MRKVIVSVLFTLCAFASLPIDSQVIYDKFGYNSPATQTIPKRALAAPMTPASLNETILEPDYWDIDEFNPPIADYDRFDWTLTKRVASSSEENFILSPLGLKLALAFLTEAATGVTQNQLQSVLGFDLDRNLVRRKFTSTVDLLQKESPHYILNLGSRIYIDDRAIPRPRFAAIAQQFYKTELKTVGFHDPGVASKAINSWVSNITRERITSLIGKDDIAYTDVLVLNTLYFKSSWRYPFPNATKLGQFFVTPNTTKEVQFMNVNDKFYYAESTKFDGKILRMPYMGKKLAMYIIVPNSLMGLPRVLENINLLRSELDNLQEQYVDIILPKFKFDYTLRLDGILKELGVREAFEQTASFPGIAYGQKQKTLRISKVLQRLGIDVDELGSIDFSATGITLVNKFGLDFVEVLANRPFLFFIQDEATRQLLFTGRVSDPS